MHQFFNTSSIFLRFQVVKMQSLLLELWGDDTFFDQRSLHVFISKLRHKLNRDERIRIVNVRGIGYKLIADGISKIK